MTEMIQHKLTKNYITLHYIEVSNRFMALEAAHNEVTPEDLRKGTKTVLLEVARETIGSVKSQKKKKWISDDTYAVIREKREKQKAKIRTDIKN